jgi:hypothetical protein
MFGDFVDRIYPVKLEIKDTTDTTKSASYIDLHLVLLAATFYQYNHYRNHKPSYMKYRINKGIIIHMQVPLEYCYILMESSEKFI